MFKKALSHFKTSDPILYSLIKYREPFELKLHPDPFMRLLRSIVGQQLSVKAAGTIFTRFENLFENSNITPSGLIKLKEDNMRKAGLSRQKISYIKDLAQKVLNREIELDKFGELESEIIIEELVRIKGIGRWTAEMFLMFSLGRPDVFSFGDLGLQNSIQKNYKLKKKPTVKQMEKLSKKWIPFRTYAALILWDALDNKPK